eukprot:m.144129 g.144129  ORF g.144129 m.144129 type:complete len:88 (+) comp14113_c0_seq2:114-377(+)
MFPAEQWTPKEVAEWVTGLGYPQYAACFQANFIDGVKLKDVDASRLPQIGITDFKHLKHIAKEIRQLFDQETPNAAKSIADISFTTH